MKQKDLFSEGDRLRDEGVARALLNAGEWKHKAAAWIARAAACDGYVFCSDDLTEAIGMPPGHPSAVGAAFRVAKQAGLIVEVSTGKGRRPSCHSARVTWWKGWRP